MEGAAVHAGGDAVVTDSSPAAVPLQVLVVEDSPAVAGLIRRALESDGMTIEVAVDLENARRSLGEHAPDVMVLDVELPDGSGIDLLRDPRYGAMAPAVVVSARRSEGDRLAGLEAGAEDYVVKPFYPRELAARVRLAAGRRTGGSAVRPTELVFGGLVIDLESRQVSLEGVVVELTDREHDLLAHLATFPRRVFSRADLLRDVWNSSPEWQTTKTVTEHVRRIRHKIEAEPTRPRWITTVGRAGYRFDPD